MLGSAYKTRRGQIEAYFDRTAAETWARLTSDAPVSRIRATVRAGRDEMRARLLSWLPEDLAGARVLDAGCGTGAMAVELARRGADVVAIDLSPTLIGHAAERLPAGLPGRVRFLAGDMLSEDLGRFDHAVAMDSLIHYRTADMVAALAALAPRICRSILLTHAPGTPLLHAMHASGKLFPRGDRSPAIVPVSHRRLRARIAGEPGLRGFRPGRDAMVSRGFYKSHALELAHD